MKKKLLTFLLAGCIVTTSVPVYPVADIQAAVDVDAEAAEENPQIAEDSPAAEIVAEGEQTESDSSQEETEGDDADELVEEMTEDSGVDAITEEESGISVVEESASTEAAGASNEDEPNLGANIALKAMASAAHENTPVKNVNDGSYAGNANTSWNTWKQSGDLAYPTPVTLTWDKEYEISSMRVIWWADNGTLESNDNVTFPKSCVVEYYDESDGTWKQITGMINEKNQSTDEVGVEFDPSGGQGLNGENKQWNVVKFPESIKTKQLRLLIERSGSGKNGIGISEWEVYGTIPIATGENIARTATPGADYINNGTSADNINNGELAEGSGTTWNTWKEAGDLVYPTPVTLEWDKEYEISSMRVMWWADNANTTGDNGVTFPEICNLQYYEEQKGRWTDVTDLLDETGTDTTSIGVKFGSEEAAGDTANDFLNGNNRYWNGVSLKTPVKAKKIRLLVNRSGSGQNGVGIGEWEVYGDEVIREIGDAPSIAHKATASADYVNSGTAASNVNDKSLATNADTTWNTWCDDANLDSKQPIELAWEEPYEISSMRVMWWADSANTTGNNGVTFPRNCELQYYDYEEDGWNTINAMKDEDGNGVAVVGVKYGSATASGSSAGSYLKGNNRYWNGVLFDAPVRTNRLRLLVERSGTEKNGVGIGEWEVYGDEIKSDWNTMISAKITGKNSLVKDESSTYYGASLPEGLEGLDYKWSVPTESQEILQITGGTMQSEVNVKALKQGNGKLKLQVNYGDVVRNTEFDVRVDEITGIDEYVTSTIEGKAPILPKTVVAQGLVFDEPTPTKIGQTGYDFAEEFNSKLVPVEWNPVNPADYAAGKAGTTFEVTGTVLGSEELEATAKITVNQAMVSPESNSAVTFENVQLTDDFWLPKQKVNAVNSLNAAIYRIGLPSGGEANFENAIKRLNGEPYDQFQGMVFQDSDIYKALEAISYTLSAIHDDPEMTAQRQVLENKIAEWISMIEQVQYADGYINTHFALRSPTTSGGLGGSNSKGTHRWKELSNHELYNAGHFFEAVVAYTRYREGIGEPDYSLYVVGKRFADEIVSLFGPDGTRHEVPGHEEIELALVKLAKLVEEYEGEGAGQKYIDTAKTLIDRRGKDFDKRESGYNGGDYSQDARPITEEKNGVGHAVRACYFYAGVTDIATLLPDDDPDKAAYLNTMDTIWDSVANRKTYITGGIGVKKHGEDFGADYELPNDGSYCETCASIALANWNQRMNLVHEDAKYADVVERTLYNSILVGTNLEGNLFYYNSLLEVNNGNGRSAWFECACCPPNLMRTIAALSGYMYTAHGNNVFVNMYIGSDGKVNVGGTEVGLKQETNYPWDGSVKLTVSPAASKNFTMKIRIPGWTQEQNNKKVVIKVNGEEINEAAEKGYVGITRTWNTGDVIQIEMPMEIRKTEADPNVTTNAGKVALERGPVVYCMEKAGNAQLNSSITNFNPLNFVIPRDAELNAEYNADLLKGVVEITGEVSYDTGNGTVPAKLQAIPYYAWNNRGDNGEYGQNSSSKMLIWTKADSFSVNISGKNEIGINESVELTGTVAGAEKNTFAWKIADGDSVEIVSGTDSGKLTVKGVKGGTSTLELTVKNDVGEKSAQFVMNVKDETTPDPGPNPNPNPNPNPTPDPTPTPDPSPSPDDDKVVVTPDIEDKGDGTIDVTIPDVPTEKPDEKKDVTAELPGEDLQNAIQNSGENEVHINVTIPDSITNSENVNLNGLILPKEALQAAKDAKKDITVNVTDSMGNTYSWGFAGKDVDEGKLADVNLKLEARKASDDQQVSDKLYADESGIVIDFAHNGELPAEASVTIDAQALGFKPGDKVTLYYYNDETGKLEPKGKAYKVDKDGKITVEVSHCSKYVLKKTTAIKVAKMTGVKTTASATAVKVSWKKNPNATGYRVYRYNTSSKKYVKVADVKGTSYTDKGLKPAAAYRYAVRAYTTASRTYYSSYTGNLKVLTKPAVPSSVKAKRTSKVSTKTTAELSFKKVDRATTYRIYKYDKKTKKYTMAFRVVNNKLYQYNSKTKKYAKVNNVKVKGGVITCSLKNLNLKSERSQKYIVRSTVSKTGYTTQYSANSKAVTIK